LDVHRRREDRWRSAVIYTLVEQVRRHGKDPFAYFEWVFGKLTHDPAPEELTDLLPVAWMEARGARPQPTIRP
jgi:hypothetical protein